MNEISSVYNLWHRWAGVLNNARYNKLCWKRLKRTSVNQPPIKQKPKIRPSTYSTCIWHPRWDDYVRNIGGTAKAGEFKFCVSRPWMGVVRVTRPIFTARRYASVVFSCYRVSFGLSVCPSVCLLQAGIVSKLLTQDHGTAPHDSPESLVYCCQKSFSEFERILFSFLNNNFTSLL